jgi:ABC-type thiamine transport system ATPase subunit
MEIKGSEWRKWNFHVHTKGTNKNDQFTSSSIEDFFYIFFKSAFDNKVEAIGITDYFSIDRYLEAVDYVSEIENKENAAGEKLFTDEEVAFIKEIFLFPNVELRMLPATDRGRLINIHCLFNPEYVPHLENDFFGHIENQDGKKMNRHGLTDYGKELDSSLTTDEQRYKKGIDSFVIDLKTLKSVLNKNKNFRDNCILVVSNSNNDGASAVQKHYDLFENEEGSLDGLRSSIYKISHAIFSTNIKDINYFLGKRLEGTDGYNEDIYKQEVNDVIRQRGSLKSCLVGCDSHKESTLFSKFTWVKADLTFEGLRQICFEPEQRVKIQTDKPDFKEDKVVIDQVKFHSPNNVFTPEVIQLNQNLNVIIGGKSSGKSILLYSIAKTLLPDNSILLNENREEKYDLTSLDPDFNFEITSRAGISQKMFREDGENSIIPDIKYIPQNYLVKLAEPEVNKKGRPLNKLVRDLINEDDDSKTKYDNFIRNVKQYDKEREDLIDKYFELIDDTESLENELKTKSNKEVLETNIASNTKKVEELNKAAGLTTEQLEEYKKIQERQLISDQKSTDFKSDFESAKTILKELDKVAEDLISSKNTLLSSLKLSSIKSYYEDKLSAVDLLKDTISALRKELKIETNEEGEKYFAEENPFKTEQNIIESEATAIDLAIKPFQQNEEIQKQITVLNLSIANDKKLLSEIDSLGKQIIDKKALVQSTHEDIFKIYEESYNEYVNIIAELKDRTLDLEKDGLKIEGIPQFNFPKLYKNIYEISDGRTASYNHYPQILDNRKKATTECEFSSVKEGILNVFSDIMNNSYALLPKINKKHAIKALLDDYYFDYWKITYKNDKLGEMSTGKASFVILMLIIGLSKSKSPILIDQPEDNLDNRSITRDLVYYLKNKKLERQIIVVTHNANIVVNSDAENVIVANQKGQNNSESSSEFQFDYINGAIENTSPIDESETDLLKSMGIREHVAEIVEGGKEAFILRERKYRFEKNKS